MGVLLHTDGIVHFIVSWILWLWFLCKLTKHSRTDNIICSGHTCGAHYSIKVANSMFTYN